LHLESGNIPKLADVVENYPNTNVAHIAAVVLADKYLGGGCDQLFVNKAGGEQELGKAIRLYELIREQSREASLLERATFGLARAKEAEGSADSLKAAGDFYAEVVQRWPDGAFAAVAKQRAEDLHRPATKKLYDDFRNFDPKPAFSKDIGDKPNFDLNDLPREGSTAMPDANSKQKASAGEKAKEAKK
jgi:hypothetical protein